MVNYDSDDDKEVLASSAPAAVKGGYVSVSGASFKDIGLNDNLLRAITDCGFEAPSEVQSACIPKAILGNDILCQARAGMGKTAVFVLSVLHQMDFSESVTSCVVLAHTHELAYQIEKEFKRFTKHMPEVKTAVYYGGIPYKENKASLAKEQPHIAIGLVLDCILPFLSCLL